MIVKQTYYVKRDNKNYWLGANQEPLETDEIIEVRPMLFADEDKTLFLNGEDIGQAVWLKDTKQEDYEEKDVQDTEQIIEDE